MCSEITNRPCPWSGEVAQAFKAGHSRVYGGPENHINAACCDCERCRERSDKAGKYVIAVDPAKGGDHYAVHTTKVK